jgi:hypothetical protein
MGKSELTQLKMQQKLTHLSFIAALYNLILISNLTDAFSSISTFDGSGELK